MPEHYTKSTVMATFWCAVCYKNTLHQVYGGRRGACLTCLSAPAAPQPKPPAAEQRGLFDPPPQQNRKGKP